VVIVFYSSITSFQELKILLMSILNIHLVVQSLIRREGHLIVVDDGQEAAAEGGGAPRNNRILAVAPNYVVD